VNAIDVLYRIHGDDVGMVQGSEGSSLPAESFEAVARRRHVFGKDFQRDISSERCVRGLVHGSHPPLPRSETIL
jgi:hypothetical protein